MEAVLDELAEKGYGRLSMDAVARRSGASKSALYRRWPSKQEMAVDVVSRLSLLLAEFANTGSLRDDVRSVFEAVIQWLDDPRLGRILPDLVAEAHRNETLAEALRTHIDAPRRIRAEAILERAIERGELAPAINRELVLDLFGAQIFWRLSVRRMPVTSDYLDDLTDFALTAMKNPTSHHSAG
ncbi:TetR/AcrR family transcriptional regulator [Saccharopolyspora spinosa]|uniref:TetR/AcrR family transcriptional regulator n=1 Tax=Saccharopolyspora spinosa TaxID=60894 RepID=UPI0002F95790|nr:TetR/AcrR family transcriptional regulator [Saccharopolyspora spinosa]